MRIKTKMKEFAITMMAAFSMLNVSCDPNGGGGTKGDFTPSDALKQALAEDFPGATDVQWTEYDVYAVASFYNTVVVEQASKASSGTARDMTAWYTNTSSPELVQDQRTMQGLEFLPAAVRQAFESSAYNRPDVWRVDEVEVHNRRYGFDGQQNTVRRVYKIELDAIVAGRPDVDLFYDETGLLLNEKLDYDDRDDDDHIWDDDDMPFSDANNQAYVDFIKQKYPEYRIEEMEREYSRGYGAMVVVAELERVRAQAKDDDWDDDDWDDDRDDDELSVYMTEEATWIGTSQEMDYNAMPDAVRTAMNNRYPRGQWDWEDDGKHWDCPSGQYYSVELEQEDRYETELTAYFQADGTFVKEVKKFDD